jgi:carboxylesterase
MGLWLRGPWTAAGTNGAGVLLLHGFSGDPRELLPLGEGLAAAGFGVHIPVLPGHGGVPHDLADHGWRDWLGAARAALQDLRHTHGRVIVGGFSMGGALASLLAAESPPAALLLLAMPTFLRPRWAMPLLPALKHLMPWFRPLARADFSDPAVRGQIQQFDAEIDLDDPAVQAWMRRHIRLPLSALGELAALLRVARRRLHHIAAPALVMHGAGDETAPTESAAELARRLAGPVELVWWPNSGHLLLDGPEGAAIVARAVGFCCQHATGKG